MSEQLLTATDHGSPQQRAEALFLQLEQCLKNHPGGGSDPDTLHEIQALARQLKWTSSLLAEKADSLIGWATILYSPRKHTRWNSSYQTGAEAVAHFMRCDLVSIKTILSRMEKAARE